MSDGVLQAMGGAAIGVIDHVGDVMLGDAAHLPNNVPDATQMVIDDADSVINDAEALLDDVHAGERRLRGKSQSKITDFQRARKRRRAVSEARRAGVIPARRPGVRPGREALGHLGGRSRSRSRPKKRVRFKSRRSRRRSRRPRKAPRWARTRSRARRWRHRRDWY